MTNQPPAMTHDEMLNKMGIGKDDFHDYLKKYSDFYSSLKENQKGFHSRVTQGSTVDDLAKSLGPNAKPEHVQALFAKAPASESKVMISACCL